MPAHTDHPGSGLPLGLAIVLAMVLGLAAVHYLVAAAAQARVGRPSWPVHRSVLWLLGIAAIAAAVLGPLAGQAHRDFAAHLAAHLLVGMLAPLLITLSAPITLALRSLDVPSARRLSRLLSSRFTRFLTDPVPAAVLDVGSLWLLYATPLGPPLMGNAPLRCVLPIHFLLTGYLFTVSVIGIDPAPHRRSFPVRLAVLCLAIAAHSALAKQLYAHPPAGTPAAAAERGAMLMYYGGDMVELLLLVLRCTQWYRAARLTPAGRGEPRTAVACPSSPGLGWDRGWQSTVEQSTSMGLCRMDRHPCWGNTCEPWCIGGRTGSGSKRRTSRPSNIPTMRSSG